jgi:MFS family permease
MFGLINQYKGLSKSIYVIFIAKLVTSMGAFIWPLLTLILSRKLGYSSTLIAFIGIGIGLLYIPAHIIGGKLADKYNRKHIIIIFDLISVSLFFLCSFLEPGTFMTVSFVLAGLFANMEIPSFDALLAQSTKPQEREKAYSLGYLGYNLGMIFGAAVGGILIESHLNLAFLFDGITTITSTLLIVMFVKVIKVEEIIEEERNEYEENNEEMNSVVDIFMKRKPLIVFLITISLLTLIYSQWSFFLPLYVADIFKEKGSAIYGLMVSVNGFVVVAMTPLLTKILTNVKEMPKITLSALFITGSFLLILNAKFAWLFFAMMIIFTIGEVALTLGMSPYLSRRVPDSHRGRFNSYIEISHSIGGILGQIIIGIMLDSIGFKPSLFIILIIGIFTISVAYFNIGFDKKVFYKLYKEESSKEVA